LPESQIVGWVEERNPTIVLFTEAAPGKIDFARCDAWFSFLFVAASRYADLAWNLWDSWR